MLTRALILTALCAAILALPGWARPTPQDVQARLDGQPITFECPPQRVDGRVMVPLRALFESLGGEVSYLPRSRSLTAHHRQRVVELELDSQRALVDGRIVSLGGPARRRAGRTMVPLRFVCEVLGADVHWDEATRTIVLNSLVPARAVFTPTATRSQPRLPLMRTHGGPLVIYSLQHSARGPLRPGERLLVYLAGEPACRASFDILGIASDVPMQEIIPGQYLGHLLMPLAGDALPGTLVGRLRRDGREVQLGLNRPVRVATDLPPLTSEIAYYVHPTPGSRVMLNPPLLHARFSCQVEPNSARMLLDGRDVTGDLRLEGQNLYYQPIDSLSPGTHVVQVQALDMAGCPLGRQWSFVTGAPSKP